MIAARVIGFSLLLILLLTLLPHLLPQVEEEVPQETHVDLSGLTQDGFVNLGKELFNGKGACALCHKPAPIGRAPDLLAMDMQALTAERLADPRYQGGARDSAGYLLESMREPSRYVVAGWGVKGSADEVSPMPAAQRPPAQLSDVEINAIIAYLQAKDGHAVTVALPTAIEASTEQQQTITDQPSEVERLLQQYACTSCHALDSNRVLLGPGLGDVGARLSEEEIRRSILEPNAVLTEGFPAVMPTDFAQRMTVQELQLIVGYLMERQ